MVISTSHYWNTNYIIVPRPNLCSRTGAKVRGDLDPITGHTNVRTGPSLQTAVRIIHNIKIITDKNQKPYDARPASF